MKQYDKALAYALTGKLISYSVLQRELNINFNKSARLIDQLMRDGIIERTCSCYWKVTDKALASKLKGGE